METQGFAPTWDDLYTECMQPHRSAQSTTQTSVYMRVWLAPHQPSGWAVISERTVTFWKLAPRSSSLSLCISVSPHHSGGRPTKAFVLQWAVQQNLHKHADSILLTEGKKRLRKVEKRLRLRKEEKYNYGRGKTAWKCLWCVCVFERENILNRGRQRDTLRPGSKTDRRSKMNPAPRAMMGRRGCVGRVEMDGWREVGCCVTWWRELSSSSKTQDLGAVSCRERWGGDFTTWLSVFFPNKWKTEENWGDNWHLAISSHSLIWTNKLNVNALCVENQIIPPCESHLIRSNLGSVSHVVTLCTVEDLLSSQGVFICLPLYHFLPSFSLVPSSAELSLLFQCCSLQRQIVRTSNEGIVQCNRNKCSPGNDLSCSRLPGGLQAHPGS